MADKRKSCGNNHRFHEHSIGAGLTRKVCSVCGLLQIGQRRRVALAEDSGEATAASLFVKAS